MGLSLCERNGLWAHSHSQKSSLSCGFPIPPRPTLGFPLGTKKVNQSWFFGLRTRNGREFSVLLKAEASSRSVDGDLLEEELKFKPSFEEYLKAMESVRTGREKKQTDSSKRYESNNEESRNLRDFDIEERGRREMKGAKKIGFEEKGNSGNSHTLVGEGKGRKNDVGISRKSDRDSENGTWEKRKSRSVQESQRSGELEGQIDSKERGSRDLKGVKRLGFEVKGKSRNSHSLVGEGKGRKNDVGINRKLERDSGNSTWEKRRSISVRESQRSGAWEEQFDFKERGSRELKGAKRLGFEMKGNSRNSHSMVGDGEGRENEVGIYRKLDRDFENGRGEKRRSISVQESQRSVEMSGHNFKERGSRELKGMKRLGFEEKGDSRNSHNMVLDKLEGKGSKSDLGFHRKLDVDFENGRWVKRKTINVQESKRGGELEGQSFRIDNGSFRGTKMRLERNYSQVETVPHEKTSVDNVQFRRSNKPRAESSSEEEVEFERAAFKSLEEFGDVMDKPRVSRNEMEERIQKLARCLNGADIDMPEWMFSKMMRSAQIRFSDHSITRIIQILGKLGNWRRVLQLVEWLQLRDRFKSHKMRNIHTTALCVLGKARRPVEALNLFHAMQEHMSTYPDLVAYHSIAVTLGQVGHMKELFEVIDSMRSPPKKKFKPGILEKWDPRLEPDIVVYNAVLNACVRRKQWEGAFWVLQKLKEQGQQPSSTTYGLVMEVMFECGKYNLVHDFFKKVLKSSIPNALTYKVLVNTLWKEGKTDEAISAVEAMERRGIIGSAALYYDLARCLCSAGRCQEGLIQIDKICKVANKPLVVTYTGLIQACLDAGNIQDGAYIYSHMHKFCSPNLVTCNILLKAYREHGMFEEAKGLFLKMLEDADRVSKKEDYKERVVPDIYTFDTMLHACVKERQWDDFEFIYKQMLHHGYHFNPKRHLRMIMEASRVGKGELLETTWKNLAQAGQTPPPLLARQMFSMKLEQGDHAAALSSISSHRFSSELQVFSRNSWLNCFKENAHRFRRDTLVKLLHEGSNILLVSGDDSQHLIFQNLVTSCREFLDGNVTVSKMYSSTNSQQTLVKQL